MEIIEPHYHATTTATYIHQFTDGYKSDQEILDYYNQSQNCWYTRNGMGMGNGVNLLHFGKSEPVTAYILVPLFTFLFWLLATVGSLQSCGYKVYLLLL